MKTKMLLLGILFSLNYSDYAQLQCGTESTPNYNYTWKATNSYSTNGLEGISFCVNVYFHVFIFLYVIDI
jgi:hypothetical protein